MIWAPDGARQRPADGRRIRTSPILCRSVCLLDLHAAFPAPAIGSLAAARNVAIAVDDAPAVGVAIDGDRLTLVLVNLIDNAVKHGRLGGCVFVTAGTNDRRFVRVTVDDDGPGIAPADRERVFTLGQRAATPALGSGIGLAVVRLMLERAGGRVELEESPLGGARFTVFVPRA